MHLDGSERLVLFFTIALIRTVSATQAYPVLSMCFADGPKSTVIKISKPSHIHPGQTISLSDHRQGRLLLDGSVIHCPCVLHVQLPSGSGLRFINSSSLTQSAYTAALHDIIASLPANDDAAAPTPTSRPGPGPFLRPAEVSSPLGPSTPLPRPQPLLLSHRRSQGFFAALESAFSRFGFSAHLRIPGSFVGSAPVRRLWPALRMRLPSDWTVSQARSHVLTFEVTLPLATSSVTRPPPSGPPRLDSDPDSDAAATYVSAVTYGRRLHVVLNVTCVGGSPDGSTEGERDRSYRTIGRLIQAELLAVGGGGGGGGGGTPDSQSGSFGDEKKARFSRWSSENSVQSADEERSQRARLLVEVPLGVGHVSGAVWEDAQSPSDLGLKIDLAGGATSERRHRFGPVVVRSLSELLGHVAHWHGHVTLWPDMYHVPPRLAEPSAEPSTEPSPEASGAHAAESPEGQDQLGSADESRAGPSLRPRDPVTWIRMMTWLQPLSVEASDSEGVAVPYHPTSCVKALLPPMPVLLALVETILFALFSMSVLGFLLAYLMMGHVIVESRALPTWLHVEEIPLSLFLVSLSPFSRQAAHSPPLSSSH